MQIKKIKKIKKVKKIKEPKDIKFFKKKDFRNDDLVKRLINEKIVVEYKKNSAYVCFNKKIKHEDLLRECLSKTTQEEGKEKRKKFQEEEIEKIFVYWKQALSYYSMLFELVWFSSWGLILYSILNILILSNIITVSSKLPPTSTNEGFWLSIVSKVIQPFTNNNFDTSLYLALFIVFAIITVLHEYGSKTVIVRLFNYKVIRPSPSKSAKILVATTVFFIILLSLPVLFLGGGRESCFSSLLIVTCSVTVITAKKWSVRLPIAALCLLIYGASIFFNDYFIQITINEFYYNSYNVLYVAGAVLSVIISMFLSSRGGYNISDHIKQDRLETN